MPKNNVVKFYPKNAADDPDLVLEQAIGQYQDVLIIGWDKNGALDARGSRGVADGSDVLWLVEQFKYHLIRGDYGDVQALK